VTLLSALRETRKNTQDNTRRQEIQSAIDLIHNEQQRIANIRRDFIQNLNDIREMIMDWGFDTITMFALSVALSIIGLSMSLFGGDQYALIVLFAAGGSVSVGGGFLFQTWRPIINKLDDYSKTIAEQDSHIFSLETQFRNYL
jgi:hypothetical protein